MTEEFEPTIIAFFCNWCTYTAADLAGTSRLSYPPNVKIIRVMCSGMVDPKYVIKALLDGADGVLVSGCNPGVCHYINGNFKARRRIKLLKEILPHFGFETERLRLTWIAARPMPGASYMVSNMSSTSWRTLSSTSVTGFAVLRRRASGKCRMSRIAILSTVFVCLGSRTPARQLNALEFHRLPWPRRLSIKVKAPSGRK